MTMRIGPIELENPQIQIPNRQKVSDYFKPAVNKDNIVYTPVGQVPTSYSVKLAVPTHIYKQIEGISEWTTPYPIVLDELSVDMLGISGWGFIGNVKIEYNQNPTTVIMSCDVAIIEQDENAYLKMDYTNGKESGSTIQITYPDMVNETVFTDHFGGFDTDSAWEVPISSGLTGASITAPAGTGKLKLTGSATANNVEGSIFTTTQDSISVPFTMDFNMEWVRYAAKYGNSMRIGLFTEKPVNMNDFYNNDNVIAYIYNKPTYCNLHFRKTIGNKNTELTTVDTLSSSNEKSPKIRFAVDVNGKLTISKDTTGSGTYTQVWGSKDPGWDINDGLYIVIGFSNWGNTTETVYCADVDAYNYIKTTPRNVVPFLPGCNILNPTTSFYRDTEEGRIYLCANPSDYMIFQTSFANWDKGSVKVFNNNNEDSTYRRVFNEENVFTKTSWYASNGLLKLFTDNNNKINFQYWNGTNYTTLNQFDIGTINYVKPFFISPEKCVIQINNTYWWLFRGKQHVLVNHTSTDLGYIEKTCYDCSTSTEGQIISPPADKKIPMLKNFYCNIWNKGIGTCSAPSPSDDIRLQILQTSPTTIYSNKIPATEYTGLVWFDNTLDPVNNGNGYLKLAREFFNMVDTKIVK